MFELNVRIAAGAAEALGEVEMPRAFVLVGKGSSNIVGRAGDDAWVVDAEGVVLRSGAVYAWCCTGCCPQPRYWSSVDAAGDFHGSAAVRYGDGAVRALDKTLLDASAAGDEAPSDAVPGGDVPEAG